MRSDDFSAAQSAYRRPGAEDEALANTWVEVSADALRSNLGAVRSLLQPGTRLAAVVKANAYGHGLEAARVLSQAGADLLAVTTLGEALALRNAGVSAPVLVFCPLLREQADTARRANLILTVDSEEQAKWLSEGAAQPVQVHVKVDTGMGRIGVLPNRATALLRALRRLSNIQVQGIYTHLATAMQPDARSALAQVQRFRDLLEELDGESIRPAIVHCANSAALLRWPECQMDMVRVGTLLYGQLPASFLAERIKLAPTWRMLTRVVDLKSAPAGWSVGYGAECHLRRESRLAIVPVGYADGFGVEVAARTRRSLKERARSLLGGGGRPGWMKIHGKLVPIVGRMSMQFCTLDVTDIPDVAIGTPVEVPCRRVNSNPSLPRVFRDAGPAENLPGASQ